MQPVVTVAVAVNVAVAVVAPPRPDTLNLHSSAFADVTLQVIGP